MIKSLVRNLNPPFEVGILQTDDWPTWWSKIELFKLEPPVRYLDLDIVLCGNVDFLKEPCPNMKMIWEDAENGQMPNSSVMGWDCDLRFVYDKFVSNPQKWMDKYSRLPNLGDQAFIYDTIVESGMNVDFWKDDRIIHFRDILNGAGWEDRSLVWWTHQPKPLSLKGHPLVKEHWR